MAYNNKLHLPIMLSMDLHDIFNLYKEEEQENFSPDEMIWYENGFFQESSVRRKRKKRKNLLIPGSQLYQFLLKLLDHQEHENIIKWAEKQNGVFQIINKEKLAELWGRHKQRKMTYESLSRALRYYYKLNILKAVPNKLRYQFTASALEEWQRIRYLDRIPV